MTTCKHCGKRRENHYEKIDGRACCNPNGKGTVFEPSTEGTHDALLPYAKSWQVELKKTCWNNENLNAAIANAEKLRGQ